MLTFMIYLNDGSDFSGGDTASYANGPSAAPDANPAVARLRPKMGSLILFDHSIWHAERRSPPARSTSCAAMYSSGASTH